MKVSKRITKCSQCNQLKVCMPKEFEDYIDWICKNCKLKLEEKLI